MPAAPTPQKMLHILTTSLPRNLAVAAAIGVLWMYIKKPCRTSVLSGAAYVQELLHGHERRAFKVFQMPITVFEDLCTWLRKNTEVDGTKGLDIKESVAIFLYIIGRNASNRDAQERFQHSGETISR
jgi:hypothetical protein